MWQTLKQVLSQRQKTRIVDANRVPAAVLVPIYYKQNEYYTLLTERTERVEAHKGQISLPGGAYEERDGTLLNTALRESAEEIGLVTEAIEPLGELDDFLTQSSSYIITPFVAAIPYPYPFKLDPTEVAAIIEVPLSALLDRERRHQKTENIGGQAVTTYFYHYQGKVIWGATARILNQFLDIFTRAIKTSVI